jgi:hypothetical protein
MSFDSHKEYEHIIPTLLVVFAGTALLLLPDAAERRAKWVSSLCFQFEPFCMHYTWVQAKRKLESQSKEVARVLSKRKPGNHITYSWECKKV